MKPAEVYQIYLQFLGDLAVDDHKGLAAFGRERGLNDEAQVHDQKAQGK
jgi:hypothetical protein